jgi:hypothetical protein
MRTHFKISRKLLDEIRIDLSRPHSFAFERVGFITCRVGKLEEGGWVLLAANYNPVEDEDYVDDDSVGAMIGSAAIRKMMQRAYDEPYAVVHVHMHDHRGRSGPSITDAREMSKLIPNFWNVRRKFPHAAVILSRDSMSGTVWDPSTKAKFPIEDFTVVGTPMLFIRD